MKPTVKKTLDDFEFQDWIILRLIHLLVVSRSVDIGYQPDCTKTLVYLTMKYDLKVLWEAIDAIKAEHKLRHNSNPNQGVHQARD